MKCALTFSINWARYWSLKGLQEVFPSGCFTEADVQTCTVELLATPINNQEREVHLKGTCRGQEFRTEASIQRAIIDYWEITSITVYLGGVAHQYAAFELLNHNERFVHLDALKTLPLIREIW